MQHLLSRARCDEQQLLDSAADWAVAHLTSGRDENDVVLIVDETADAKSSADCAGAARQYSGTLGGVALCQVAVTLTCATPAGHALIGRALYLPADWASDDERHEQAGVPDEATFATKPELAGLLLRRHRYTGTISYFLCWTPAPVPLARLIAVAVTRWKIEMVFTQLAKRAVRPVGGGWEHVADLDPVVGDDHPVDEQFGQQPALLEGGGGQSGADGLAECLDPVGDGLQFQPLAGGGVQLALLGRQGGAAAVQLVPLALEFGQGDDLGQVGVEQPLLLAVQLAQGVAERRLPGVEFLGQPGAALRPV